MKASDNIYKQYCRILKNELIPAMGCTEPIAIAYAAAKAKEVLGNVPDRLKIEVSGNIIKNVKSVVVPHTGGMHGIEAAAAAGAVAGNAELKLEVISHVTDDQISQIGEYLKTADIKIIPADTKKIFDIMITAYSGESSSFVRIADYHTNIICIKKNGKPLFEKETAEQAEKTADYTLLNISDIVDFADNVNISDVKQILERQIEYNMAIASEGLSLPYGANVGKTLLSSHSNDLTYKMRAYAAAASDARMNGCELPVIINSGSGNQGITASVPVIVYARENSMSEEMLLRALCVSNLVTIHLKAGIGRLSAYCGVVSAGCGAASGIAYLQGGRYDMISHTIVNALAVDSGIVCDGAKASCAAKISSAVDAGLLGLDMYKNGNQFLGGDGLVKKGVENTIDVIGRLARNGMEETDREIIRLMME